MAEIDRVVALLRVPVRMKQSKIILVGNPGCAAGTAAARDFDLVRAQLGPEVIQITRMFEKWGANVLPDDMMTLLHRVLFYGDHTDNIKDLAHLMGLRVLLEGKEMAETPPPNAKVAAL